MWYQARDLNVLLIFSVVLQEQSLLLALIVYLQTVLQAYF